jgi:hypothetical protein
VSAKRKFGPILAASGIAASLLASVEIAVPAGATTTWSIKPSPTRGFLNGVSCVSSSFCVAVGGYYLPTGSTGSRILTDTWNGTAWTADESSDVAAALTAVSCVSTVACTAVGYSATADEVTGLTTYDGVIETWNGSTWSSPQSFPNDQFNGVSCEGTSFCKAVVGTSAAAFLGCGAGCGASGAIESWDGTTWTADTIPSLNATFSGVKCVSTVSCETVGAYEVGRHYPHGLVESWNGTTWSLVASPAVGQEGSTLQSVACDSATQCKAVGYSVEGTGVDQALAESWNGTTWSVKPTPRVRTIGATLSSLTCPAANSCKAVGTYDRTGVQKNLIESWNGATWSVVSGPLGTGPTYLKSVSCSSSFCVAVGQQANPTNAFIEAT